MYVFPFVLVAVDVLCVFYLGFVAPFECVVTVSRTVPEPLSLSNKVQTVSQSVS